MLIQLGIHFTLLCCSRQPHTSHDCFIEMINLKNEGVNIRIVGEIGVDSKKGENKDYGSFVRAIRALFRIDVRSQPLHASGTLYETL